MPRKTKPKTIRFSELKRLSFCNSKDLPQRVWALGKLMQWVGIGWIELDPDEARGDEPTVVDGPAGPAEKSRRKRKKK